MTNKEQIELLLKHGLHVGVKNKEGKHLTISPMKDEDGFYRTSSVCETLKEAKEYIGQNYGYSNLEEQSKHWTEITPFHLDFEPYPVGMKMKNTYGGTSFIEIGKVKSGNMYTAKDIKYANYSHTELIPYFEEEKPTITLTDEELLAECERRAISTKITNN